MLKHYVNFDTPGFFFPETETRQVRTRIPAKLRNIPKYTYAIDYFDREEIVQNGERLLGSAKNKSRRILFGRRYNLKELEEPGYSKEDALYRNAQSHPVVKCITGNWQPICDKEILLADYGELKNLKELI